MMRDNFRVEFDFDEITGHLVDDLAGNVDYVTAELRRACGVFGERLADLIEEQRPKPPKPTFVKGDVVSVDSQALGQDGEVNVMVRRASGAWLSSIFGIGHGWSDDEILEAHKRGGIFDVQGVTENAKEVLR